MINTKIVLDCSITVSWFIDDEAIIGSYDILDKIAEVGALVPSIWKLEVGNVLLVAQRRNRITREQRLNALYTLNELPIIVDDSTAKHAWFETIELAQEYNLSLYDASYLELCIRNILPIATFDKALQDAAIACGITVIK